MSKAILQQKTMNNFLCKLLCVYKISFSSSVKRLCFLCVFLCEVCVCGFLKINWEFKAKEIFLWSVLSFIHFFFFLFFNKAAGFCVCIFLFLSLKLWKCLLILCFKFKNDHVFEFICSHSLELWYSFLFYVLFS